MNVSELLGKTLKSVEQKGDDEIIFTTTEGDTYKLYHSQNCCESVRIEDINGDLQDLVGPRSPLLQAEASTSNENPEAVKVSEYQDSFTWTFYKFATRKGYVTIRWYGESNGYYSEGVDFVQIYSTLCF
jgi:hypothetical protein